MIFTETGVAGAWIVELEPHADERGYFARTWCAEEFARHGLSPELSQCSVSYNHRANTLRGLHYQAAPNEEDKLVRCTAGAIFDVALDLRLDSPTYLRHVGVELTARSQKALYVPKGCAHGFQTLQDGTMVFYQMSTPYVPGSGRGVRWDDPAFGIAWPLPAPAMAERDAKYPDFDPAAGRQEAREGTGPSGDA